MRSANEIWWRANDPDRVVEQDEMKIAEREDTEAAVLRFHDICWALRGKGELVGYEGKMNPVVAVTIARDIKAALSSWACSLRGIFTENVTRSLVFGRPIGRLDFDMFSPALSVGI
ncbi:MAG: hypothetical protein OXH16_18405 [Gemmatimonadetes bacterium]|nr:hypothetical protein [Gemmatimonadota bacterium]